MMDDLLIKYLALQASSVERKQVEDWVALSQNNRKYFEQFSKIWDQSTELAGGSVIDEDAAWQKLQHRIGESTPRSLNKKNYGWIRIAAGIILVAGVALITYMISGRNEAGEKLMAISTTNDVKAGTLPDGSIATLNKHSGISYPSVFKGNTRRVRLQGEAFFNVTPDKNKPFIIEVSDVQIKVVGTSFNVKNSIIGTEVIVETGIVQVMKNNKMIELEARERIFLPKADTLLSKETSTDKLYNYYISRTFVCDNTPLWKLVDKLNEAYGADIRIVRKELRNMRLTVTFNEESLDMILSIISQTLLVKVSHIDNTIILN